MPSFDSPLGNKKINTPALKEVDIPDDSGFNQNEIVNPVVRRRQAMPVLDETAIQNLQTRLQQEAEQDPAEMEKEFREAREARKAKLMGKDRLNDGAKRRIEMLLRMTSFNRQVDIEGNIFVLQEIPVREMRAAMMAASEFDGTIEFTFEMIKQFLARSLTQIAGVDFSQFIGSNDIDAKLAFIDELSEPLLNRLYSEYLEMVRESKEKYSIKNELEAKEIIENLKK